MLDKLIEAVKSLKDNSSATSEASQNPPSTEAAINRLFPSIGTFRSTAPGRLNPNSNYVPTRRKRNANPGSTSSATKKKAPAGNSKPVLKDIILLPSPRIESVSRGRFREYLYGNGFAESAVSITDEMSEQEIKAKIAFIFKDTLEFLPEPKYSFVRAIGCKIIELNSGPYTGKLIKYISKQGPVYIRSDIDVPGEDLKRWLDEKQEGESSDDDSLMKSAFEMNNGRKAAKSTTVPVKVELSDNDDEPAVARSTSAAVNSTSVSFNTKTSR